MGIYEIVNLEGLYSNYVFLIKIENIFLISIIW